MLKTDISMSLDMARSKCPFIIHVFNHSLTHTHTHTHTRLCYMCMCSVMSLFAAPWTVVFQAPLSMEFSRLPFLTPGGFPNPGIKAVSLVSPALTSRLSRA